MGICETSSQVQVDGEDVSKSSFLLLLYFVGVFVRSGSGRQTPEQYTDHRDS